MHAPHDARHHENIADLFNRHGLRTTRQRIAVYEALAATTAHPTADQLFCAVSGKIDGLSLATVYNALEAFCRAGLAQKLPSPNGSARFDATTHQHVHVRCSPTNEVHDVPESLSDKLLAGLPADVIRQIESHLGVKVRQVSIELIADRA